MAPRETSDTKSIRRIMEKQFTTTIGTNGTNYTSDTKSIRKTNAQSQELEPKSLEPKIATSRPTASSLAQTHLGLLRALVAHI